MAHRATRRGFMRTAMAGMGGIIVAAEQAGQGQQIQGFEQASTDRAGWHKWKPISDRKIRVGIAGYGVCQFGAAFGFQDHPNVTVAAVSDLVPEQCQTLAKICRCEKTYPSFEEMVKDDRLEAVFVATDAPSHARHAVLALKHGKHIASAVPAAYGSLEEAQELYETVKSSDHKYMMFETSSFHHECLAMRRIFQAGGFGKLVYSEGEYYHYMPTPIPSFRDWRVGLPPQWYPTHSNAYYVCITGGSFTEVSCMGMPSKIEHLLPSNNPYKNAFGTEIALFRTSEGGSARMAVSWDTPGFGGEMGRLRSQKGTYYEKFSGTAKKANLGRPPLPPE